MPKHFEFVGLDRFGDGLAKLLGDTIRARIANALDVEDHPAKPLTKKYAERKVRRGVRPVRDWKLTGRTLAAIAPVYRNGRIYVGFNDDRASQVAAINNALGGKQFGMSPSDRESLIAAINEIKGQLVKVVNS